MNNENSKNEKTAPEYPYLCWYALATVYPVVRVVFTDEEADDSGEKLTSPLKVAYRGAFINGKLTKGAREVLIEKVHRISVKERKRICVIFGKHDCVYCEPNGSKKNSTEPPSGFIKIDSNKIVVNPSLASPLIFDSPKDEKARLVDLLHKGNIARENGTYKKAIYFYNKALEIDECCFDAWLAKALIFARQGRHKQADGFYYTALQIDSHKEDVWCNKGISLRMLGKLNEAIECFDKALEINPNHIYARFFKSITLGDLGKYKEAKDELMRIIQKSVRIFLDTPEDSKEKWCNEEFEHIYIYWLKDLTSYIDTLSSINESIMERMKGKGVKRRSLQ